MMKFENQAQNASSKKRKGRSVWIRVVAMMLALVYIITLPRFSAASNSLLLDCPLIVHEHGPECYDEEEQLICGEADYVIHAHAEGCWDEAGNLVCQLPEIAPHEHQESCYDETGMLICGELELHTHSSENCYDADGQLTCGKIALFEHVHGDECFHEAEEEAGSNLLLDCPLSVHEHGPECYDEEKNLICGEADYVVHIHTEGCLDETGNLLCQLPEIAPHEHQESCYDEMGILICDKLEMHTHSPENCYDLDGQLICEKTVLYEHIHGDGCFREIAAEEDPNDDDNLIDSSGDAEVGSNLLLDCPLIVHEHGTECYDEEEQLICGEADYVVHVHTEGCWDEEGSLLCQLPEIAPHEHQESCYDETGMLICGELEMHTHSPENCYDLDGQLICEKTVLYEHVHGDGCFREVELDEPTEEQPKPSDENSEVPAITNEDTDLTVNIGNVTVSVYDNGNAVPEGASLRVSQIEGQEHQEQLDKIKQALQNALQQPEQPGMMLALAAIYPYDISFVNVDGDEVQLNGNVTVSLEFQTPVEKFINTGDWKLFHLQDEETPENLEAEIATGENGVVTKVTFTADHFSPFVLADVVEGRNLEEYIRSIGGKFNYKIIWKIDEQNNVEIYPDDEGHYNMYPGGKYKFSMYIYSTDHNGFQSGVYTCQLPKEVFEIKGKVAGEVKLGNDVIGTYVVEKDGLLAITFEENSSDAMGVEFWLNFDFEIPSEGGESLTKPEIKKTGKLDLNDGKYHFMITASIPKYNGLNYGQWNIVDQEKLGDESTYTWRLNGASVAIRYDGESFVLPEVSDANEDDTIAYYCNSVGWLYLVNRKEENCRYSLKDQFNLEGGEDWCTHWSLMEDADLIITYATDTYGLGTYDEVKILDSTEDEYINEARLRNGTATAARSEIKLPIPKLIKKTETSSPSGNESCFGSYTIVINEGGKVNLGEYVGEGEEAKLKIVDEMKNMFFVLGSLVIDEDNTRLAYEKDYTYEWDNDTRVLTIYLQQPGAHEYTIKYDVMIEFDEEETGRIYYGNIAILRFSNFGVSSETNGEMDIDSGSVWYRIHLTIEKIDERGVGLGSSEWTRLPGARYGLYSADGHEITTGTTNDEGIFEFRTNFNQGIILAPNVVYYLQELTAPAGYYLDPNKYYFYFSDEEIEEFEQQYPDIKWLNVNNLESMVLSDKPSLYDLPAAGGIGTLPFYLLGGLLLTGAVLNLGSISRKKRISNS